MQHSSSHPLAYTVISLLSLMLVLQLLIQPVSWVEVPLLGLEPFGLQGLELTALAFQPQTLLSEPWRLFSAHLIHLDWPHALTNMLAFTAACVIFAPFLSATRLLVILGAGTIGASLMHTVGETSVSFVGFSALTHAIVAFAAVQITTAAKSVQSQAGPKTKRTSIQPWIGYLMLTAIVVKSAVEIAMPAEMSHWLGASVAAYAHLGGVLAGAGVAIGYRCLSAR